MIDTSNLGVDPLTEDTQVQSIGDVLGWDMVNHYRCVFKRVLHYQKDDNANSLQKEDLDSDRIVRLLKNLVKCKDWVANEKK